jgi:D-amino-acid oxidase
MPCSAGVIGAGVSGLTCGVLLAEHGFQTTIFAAELGSTTTSAAAGAIWFPYDVEPFDLALRWALHSFRVFEKLLSEPGSGVSMIELQAFCRAGRMAVPPWARNLGARIISDPSFPIFSEGYSLTVPLIDTSRYLPYLAHRLRRSGGTLTEAHFSAPEEVSSEFQVVVNCAGIGARDLASDNSVEPHRGQVVIVPRLNNLNCAVVCDDAPLMYAISRPNDCVFGGTNELSDNRQPDPNTTAAIVDQCSRALNISPPKVVAERVGLRPFRRAGVRVETDQLGDGRTVVHNYGHGGSGFTLSWGCAEDVLRLVTQAGSR